MSNKWMTFSLLIAVAAVTVALFASGAPRATADEAEAKETPYKLATSLEAVMYTTDSLFYEMEELAKNNKYRTIQRRSEFLAEIGNVVSKLGGEKAWDSKEWKKYATDMRDGLIQLAEVSKKKDADAFKEQWEKVEEACDYCHEDFRD